MDKDKFPELENLEDNKLRKENLELKMKLQQYEKLLQDNGLLEKLTQTSDEELVCIRQIAKLKELDDKGIPFQMEEVKILEILVKTLQIARGKAPVVEDKKKKKEEKPDVAKLLAIAGNKKPD